MIVEKNACLHWNKNVKHILFFQEQIKECVKSIENYFWTFETESGVNKSLNKAQNRQNYKPPEY
jgi:uncharacterized protein YaaR (DUF327 family)